MESRVRVFYIRKMAMRTFFIYSLIIASRQISATGEGIAGITTVNAGIEFHTGKLGPVPTVGLLAGFYSIVSAHVHANLSYRPADETWHTRGGFGFGILNFLLNLDLTYQAGNQSSAGFLFGGSLFWGLQRLHDLQTLVEVFYGYQTNFAASTENSLIGGLKIHLNLGKKI